MIAKESLPQTERLPQLAGGVRQGASLGTNTLEKSSTLGYSKVGTYVLLSYAVHLTPITLPTFSMPRVSVGGYRVEGAALCEECPLPGS